MTIKAGTALAAAGAWYGLPAMRARTAANLCWLLAALAGTALRLDQLRDQVLVDDEWHALHALLAGGPLGALRTFGETDHSIPLVLWDALLQHTVGLTELGMRLPSLGAGIAALLVVPWLVRPIAGTRAATSLAWLLAIAPLHVFYSRYARPYEPAMLASFVALVGAYRTRDGAPRWLRRVALAAAVLAPWLLPVVLPVVATALALLAADALGSARRSAAGDAAAAGARRRSALAGVAGVVAGWAVLIGGPLLGDAGALTGKVGRGSVELATVRGASELLLGTPVPLLLLACAAAMVAGAPVLARRAPRFAGWVALAAGAQVAALVVVAPHGLRFAIVFARYAFVLSPFLLLLLALGLDAADRALAARALVRRVPVVTIAALVALVAAGPLAWIHQHPNDFTSQAAFQADYRPDGYFTRFRPARLPAFYAELARAPAGTLTVLEAPWYFFWHDLAYRQRLHHQHVVVGFVDPRSDVARPGEVPRGRTDVRLRNALHVGDPAALRARGVDYVIFHRDAYADMQVPFDAPRVDVGDWLERYRALYGAPVFEDESIVVFDVRPG